MSIFSSIDSQSLILTRKLLQRRAPALTTALPLQSQSRYPLDEVTVELTIETVNHIIDELTTIGQLWLDDEDNACFHERKQIMAYLLRQWVQVGEDTTRVTSAARNMLH
jgi:hypothetical protein